MKLKSYFTVLFVFLIVCSPSLAATGIRASHILIGVDPGDSSAEKASAQKKAERLRARLVAGADFATLAKAESSCPTNQVGGDLGYMTPGTLGVPIFDRAAFALQPGEISDVVETEFGFHIITVTQRDEPEAGPKQMPPDEFLALISELNSYKYHCSSPNIPDSLYTESDRDKLGRKLSAYESCYNSYLYGLQELDSKLRSISVQSVSAEQLEELNAFIEGMKEDQEKAETRSLTVQAELSALESRIAASNDRNSRARQNYNNYNSYNNYNNSSSSRFVPTPIPQRKTYVLPGMH